MAKKKYKILVPKPAAAKEDGTEIKLYVADEIVESDGSWQDNIMDQFVMNGWATVSYTHLTLPTILLV